MLLTDIEGSTRLALEGTIRRIDDPERRRDRREQCLLLANTSAGAR
jgi:hypothetical protein